MKAKTGLGKLIVAVTLILAAAGTFIWKMITGILPDALARTAGTAAAGPQGEQPARDMKPRSSRVSRIALTLEESPRSFARSPSGTVWVAGGEVLAELSASGAEHARLRMSAAVSALAVDAGGRLYVAMADRIEVRGADGTLIRAFTDLDPAARIVAIALDPAANEVFLADAGNAVVLRYSTTGKLLRRIGEKDDARGIPGFVVPSPYFSIAVSADRKLYAANPGRHGIEIYTYDGDLVGSFYRPSMGIDGFAGCCNPACIVLLDAGRILTVEKGIKRIKILSPLGEVLEVVADEESLEANFLGDGALAGSDGSLLVLDRAAREILVFKGKKA
jgi:hypothetical protein